MRSTPSRLTAAALAADRPRSEAETTIHIETIRIDQITGPVQCDPLPPLNMG